MVFPREVLNRLKWSGNRSLDDVVIFYLHRGAPGDMMSIKGSDIVELERSFFVTADSKIPYHRIRRIEKAGEVLYEERSIKIKEG
jgi:uncharacterized protein (UPF0248 family)